jgi:parvulin-like peptidyl-prolyl isomerase
MLKAIVGGEARYSAMRSAIGEAPFVPGISMTSDGIYFTYGQMGDAYESAAFALDIYGVSDVVETADGYYVIMRLEPELETVRRKAGELLSQYQYAVIKKAIDGQKQKIEFAPNEAFDALSLVEIK